MRGHRQLMRLLVLLLCGAGASLAHGFAYEPPGRFVPGSYFELKAQFYLKNHQYRAAVEMFQLAGYWANKVAQYNLGVMYFNGIGVPADRVLGTAWLGVAAEQHHELADGTLNSAWAKLTPGEREAAESAFRELDRKYGDAVALPRAVRHYDEERRQITGTRLGMVGHIRVIDVENSLRMGDEFFAEQDRIFDTYVSRFGHAAVGEVRPLTIPGEARTSVPKTPAAAADKAEPAKPQP